MRRIGIRFEIRERDEAICARYVDMPEGSCEVGALETIGTEHNARELADKVLALALAAAGHRKVYAICRASHGRAYERMGWTAVKKGIQYRTDDDWILTR